MKKILLVSVLAALAYVGCKKKESTVSMTVTASFPVVTITGTQYFSIPVGGSLPTVNAVAYDTFYRDSLPVVIDQAGLDNTTPGLYIVTASAKNKYGYVGSASVYVAVTNISPLINLAGQYIRLSNNDTVHVSKMATGLYLTDNVGGVLATSPTAILPGYFVQTDMTTILLPSQPSGGNTLSGINGACSLVPADTTYQYVIVSPSSIFAQSTRVFKKI